MPSNHPHVYTEPFLDLAFFSIPAQNLAPQMTASEMFEQLSQRDVKII